MLLNLMLLLFIFKFISGDNDNDVNLCIDDDDDLCIAKQPNWAALVTEHMTTHNLALADTERRVFDKDGDIDIADSPYLVSILRNAGKRNAYVCGGSIIRNDVILTAAHCLTGFKAEKLMIRAGSSFNYTGGVLVNVNRFKVHGNHTFSSKNFDVGVVWLAQPLEFSETIQPIKLAESGEEVAIHTLMSVCGFGYNNYTTRTFSDSLQAVVVPIVSNELCDVVYKTNVTSNMLCAGYAAGGADSCTYDSGSPLVYNGTQYGIVSFGGECAKAHTPGVYAKVSALREWIDKQINGTEDKEAEKN